MESDALSHRAEVFRSKLIEDFQILEGITESGRRKAPAYNSSDITNPRTLEKVLLENPDQMIKFKVYQREELPDASTIDRRLTRVKNMNRLPIGVWANWLVESNNFQRVLMALIIVNAISIAVQGELPVSNSLGIVVVQEMFNFLDAITLIIFMAEIGLKWLDNFRCFWKNYWNVFDFIVTVLSAVPYLMTVFAGSQDSTLAIVAEQLTVFRVLRALKMVARFGRLRIIVLTVLEAFQSMVFITILLGIVAYIFAIVGVIFFESYTLSGRDDLLFPQSFSSLPNAMITLFQLFTLDQWYKVYNDLVKVVGPAFTCTYILLWVWIGSFVFRNLFVGIMVNNFQSITADLARRQESQKQCEELERMKEELNIEINRQDARMHRTRKSLAMSSSDNVSIPTSKEREASGQDLREQFSQLMIEEEQISKGWDRTLHAHLMALASNPVETLWPRDTLFKYLQQMEQLQENLEEYDKLQKLATAGLLELHDSK